MGEAQRQRRRDRIGASLWDVLRPHHNHATGLQTADKTFGLETMCVAGGQGMAMIVERLI